MHKLRRVSRCAIARQCGVALLLCASWAIASSGAPEPATVWTGDSDAAVPNTLTGGTVIHAARLAHLLKRPGLAVIDVSNKPRRPAELAPGAPWLPVAHHALPGTVWFPGVGAGVITPQLEQQFRARLASTLGADFNRPVVFYCHAHCWLSWNAAKRAIDYGYKKVFWFPDGIEGWAQAGLQTTIVDAEIAPETIADANSTNKPRLAILPLELTGDLGGAEFAAEHATRLEVESARLRRDLEATQMYEVLDNSTAQPDIDKLKSQQLNLHDCNGCDIGIGRRLNADLIMVAWVDRVSGLILSLSFEIHSVKDAQIVTRKSYDFRGDNDVAWNHAIDYMVRHLQEDAVSAAH